MPEMNRAKKTTVANSERQKRRISN